MGMVPIDNLIVGMVLDADVRDRTGRLLLGSGAELTSKHLHIFRTWGVQKASIAGIDGDDEMTHLPENVDLSELLIVEEALAPLFKRVDMNHPVNKELLRLAALRRIQHGNS
ncbi:MAG: hypothetical protein HXX11_03250 [Desulfuromonadales bacterium]|nr:hypothetical protein [Desulfuromonadales bacterium]